MALNVDNGATDTAIEPTSALAQSIVINEFSASTDGADVEFIEFFGDPNTDFSAFTILQIEGDSSSNEGTIDTVIDLGTTDADGYLLIELPSNELENGTITLLLVESFTGSNGNDLDTDDDGILDSTPWTVIADSVAVSDGGSNDRTYGGAPVLTSALAPEDNTFAPGGASRIPNGTDTDAVDDWVRNDFNLAGIPGFEGTLVEGEAANTPGAENSLTVPELPTTLFINEVDATVGKRGTKEFIELYDGGIGNTSLDGFVVVLYQGFGNRSYEAFDLTGFSTNDNGFFVLGQEGLAEADLVFGPNTIRNNTASAVALYEGDIADFPNSTFVTDQGLVDALVYDTNDADNLTLLNVLTPGQPQVNEKADGEARDVAMARVPDDANAQFVLQDPTPGALNIVLTPIFAIQGFGHVSPFVKNPGETDADFFDRLPADTFSIAGDDVATTGIVTAVDSNGFYIQDAEGDGRLNTSDAIFVFTGGNPSVSVGDELLLQGTVSEFFPGDTDTRNLSTTQLSFPDITVLSIGNELPEARLIGQNGPFLPQRETIEDDGFTEFNPRRESIDFFESLEGMLVTAQDLTAVAGTNQFGEIFAVTERNGDLWASGISERGTLNISPDDFNPEKIQIDEDSGVFNFDFPDVKVGAKLGDVTGVVSYNFGNFEILPTEDFTQNPEFTDSDLQPETSSILSDADTLTIATYNVLNLDPKVEDPLLTDDGEDDVDDDLGDGRFDAIAGHIVTNLNAPDIIALQEVQDNDGAEITEVTAADVTLQTLVDAIIAAGGPTYSFIDNTFITNGASGGQPGGNIRTAFLYLDDRVVLEEGSVQTIGDQNDGGAFQGARLPLVADFTFNGETVTVVNNHFSSKGGSAPILGIEQPFDARQEDVTVNGSLDERQAQSEAVQDFVEGILVEDANAGVVVLGDLNEFEFVSPVTGLEEIGLTNLINAIPDDERYSFIFQGNSQQLDHILVSDNLLAGSDVDIVHVNSEFAATDERASDHDPVVASLHIPEFLLPTETDSLVS